MRISKLENDGSPQTFEQRYDNCQLLADKSDKLITDK